MKSLCKRELRNIIAAGANHPSVIAYSMSSELHEAWLANAESFRLFSRDLPGLTRSLAPDALVFDCTGASDGTHQCELAVPVRTRAGTRDTDLDGSWLLWNQECRPLLGPIPGQNGVTRPFICHEYCWFTALSDPALAARLRRLPVVPLHVPNMIEAARKNGQAGELSRMVDCSRRLRSALRKHALELARLEPKVAGYHHWLIHDFPFCAEGVFNEFWEPPSDLSAAEFRQCNSDTVIGLMDHGRRCFTHGEAPDLSLAVSHFGAAGLRRPALVWRLAAGDRTAASGRLCLRALAPGGRDHTPPLRIRLDAERHPVAWRLSAALCDESRTVATNAWMLWSFPAKPLDGVRVPFTTPLSGLLNTCASAELLAAAPSGGPGRVFVTDAVSDDVERFLRRGGRVLLLAPPLSQGRDLPRGDGATRYRTVPYNMGTTGNMGTVIRPHPALGMFPHQGWCDFVFEPLIEGVAPFSLQPFHPQRIRPVVRSIGHMRTLEDKAYLFEVNVGKGRLLACSFRILELLGRYPAVDYLLASFIRYLEGARLADAPTVRLRAAPSAKPGHN